MGPRAAPDPSGPRAVAGRLGARVGVLALVLASTAAAFSACSTTAAPTPLGPTGVPSICIAYPANSCVSQPINRCVEVPADLKVPVGVVLTNLELRPPGQCNGIVQCGHLVLREVLDKGDAGPADASDPDVALTIGTVNDESASPVLDLDLGKLANRYATLTLVVDVITDPPLPDGGGGSGGGPPVPDGSPPDAGPLNPGMPLYDQSGNLVTATITITTAVSCPDAG